MTDTLPSVPMLPDHQSIKYLASRYVQGGRTVYAVNLSPLDIQEMVTKPDPDQRTIGNREINKKHAEDFGKYFREHSAWISPAMIMRAPAIFTFEELPGGANSGLGVLSFSRHDSRDIHILDGQHRILGFYYAAESIADDIARARDALAVARRLGEDVGAVEAASRIEKYEAQRERLSKERVSILIFVEEETKAYKQMFVDIADNAKGISKSVKADFDDRKVVNRALRYMSEHPLLNGRIDNDRDRISPASPFLVGLSNVAEIVRTVNVGHEGRVSRGQESTLDERFVADRTKEFLTVLTDGFPALQSVAEGDLSPSDLKKNSLLGSVLMLRVLAGTYYELVNSHSWTPQEVGQYFKKLDPHTHGPAAPGSIWIEHTEAFTPLSFAPRARRQDTKALRDNLVQWALTDPEFLAHPATNADETGPAI